MTVLFAPRVEVYTPGGWLDVSADVDGPTKIRRMIPRGGTRADPGRCTFRLNDPAGTYTARNMGRNTPVRVGVQLAADAFGRTLAGTLGAADTGQLWNNSGSAAADFSVSGGMARHAQPLKNIIRLSLLDGEQRDSEQVTDFSIPAVAVGASAVAGHVFKYQTGSGDYYWSRVEFDVAGALTVKISRMTSGSLVELAARSAIPGMTYTAGQPWTMRSSVSGSRLAVKIWPAGTPEPIDWTLTTSDGAIRPAGRGGLASWVVAGNSNTTELRFDNYAMLSRRFYGEVTAWPPGWNLRGTVRYVDVDAAGPLRRLGQGEPPKWSAMRRTIAASAPLAYWPMEDGPDAGQAGSGIAGIGALRIVGASTFAALEDLTLPANATIRYGTSALLNLAAGGAVSAQLPTLTAATPNGWAVSVAASIDYAAVSGDVIVSDVSTPGGSFTRWQLIYRKTTLRMQVVAYTAAGAATTVIDSPGVYTTLDTYDFGIWQNGANVDVGLGWYLGSYSMTGSVAGTVGGVAAVGLNPSAVTSTKPMPFGHLAVWAASRSPIEEGLTDSYGTFVYGSTSSWRAEAAVDRLRRLCAEEGLPLTVEAPPVEHVSRMGWQPAASFGDLIDQCADVDGGYLYETRDSMGLTYRTRASLYNQTPAQIAYVGQLAAPFEPVPAADDVRNDVTVKRTDGSSARVVVTTGPLAAVPAPAGVGVYRTEVELNLSDDMPLPDQAGWRAALGTVDRDRFEQLSVQLAAPEWQTAPAAARAAILAADAGDVLEVTGLPTWAAGDVRTMVTGCEEQLSPYLWGFTFAGVPAQPWDVAVADGPARAGAEGHTLAAAVTAGALALSIARPATDPPWTTDPADFPLDVRIGEERLTLSIITGAASPQAATVSARSVNGVVSGWPAGTEVDVWRPAVAGM